MEYGLIGARLGHSFSAQIHKALAPHSEYELCELPEEDDARRFLAQREFCAVNVTIPYKQLALAACDEVDEKAAAIGAVNTVVNRGGRLFGCNTDYAGFLYMARRAGAEFRGKNVLVLGTGGTSKTVHAAAADEGAACVLHASRTGRGGALTYEEAAARAAQFDIIVNTTPAGMYPDEDACAADPREYPNVRAVLDVVYNPMRTELLQRAQEAGARVADGLPMLVAQAFYAREHFEGRALDAQRIEQVLRALRADRANLVLVGMPSCGKSGVGKACAQALHKRFVDADAEIERRAGRPIREILRPGEEDAFRDLESEVLADLAKGSGQVIATGGGSVLRAQNVRRLRRGGPVIFLDRPLALLRPGGGRPLTQTREALERQWRERRPLYEAACHARVENAGSMEQTVSAVGKAFYEVLDREWA